MASAWNETASEDTYDDLVCAKWHNTFITQPISTLVGYVKAAVNGLLRLFLHGLDASYDFVRYTVYSNSVWRSTRNRQRLESLIVLEYHKIEKALAMPQVRPTFGLGCIEALLDLMDRWVCFTHDLEAVVFRGAYATLVRYREYVGQSLSQERPDLVLRIDRLLSDYKAGDDDLSLGGTVTVSAEDLGEVCRSIEFDGFVHQRHSVRNFTERHVRDSVIAHAVKIAQQSSFVCNRLCWRVHVFTRTADRAKILQQQTGNDGFGHLADRVLLIAVDLRAFVCSGERNQVYTDTGTSAVTLVYALHAWGIATCCLELSTSFYRDLAVRRACRIPAWVIPIMMVAIGYPPESFEVAVSARKPTESIMCFRDLAAESATADELGRPVEP
jgi:nitroreductase